MAYPISLFKSVPIVNDTVGDQDIVIFHTPYTDSRFNAFNSTEAGGIGSTAVYDPILNDQKLTFKIESENIVDEQTGSIWNMFREAAAGELEGDRLAAVAHANQKWFAWSAFFPDSELRTADFFGS